MSNSAETTKKKVVGIVPAEVLNGLATGEIKDVFNEELDKKDAKEFEKIREKMILQAFGLTKKEYKMFMDDFNKLQQTGGAASRNTLDILKDKRNVVMGQLGSNKKDKKAIAKQALEVGVAAGAVYFSGIAEAVTAATASISAAFPYLAVVLAGIGLVMAYKKYKKASKGNISDAIEKQRDYEDFLKGFIENVKKLVSAFENDKQMIMSKKKSLSKKEFNEYLNKYISSKINELGLSNELPLDEALKQQQIENAKEVQKNQVEETKKENLKVEMGGV